MDISSKYILLTRLPLFQGLSGQDLAKLENAIDLEVDTIPAMSYPIINQGDPCANLIFLASGKLRRVQKANEVEATAISYIEGPYVLEPENLYGIDCMYQYSYQTMSDCNVINIRKCDVVSHLMKQDIFRINFLNYTSSLIQKNRRMAEPKVPQNIEYKIRQVLLCFFNECIGQCNLKIKMTTLAEIISETRLNTSRILNNMEDKGLIELHRSTIIIPEIKNLL